MMIKSGYSVLFLLACVLLLSCSSGGGDGESNLLFEDSQSFSSAVLADNLSELNIQGVNGEITITGKPGADSVTIAGIKRVHSKISASDASMHLPELMVKSETLVNEYRVETVQPKDTVERNYTIDYTITLPAHFKVTLASVNGAAILESIENDVSVSMANGNVVLADIHGSAKVSLANGTIKSEVVLPLQGTVDLKVAIGDIRLSIPANTSATFSASVFSGSINVTNLVFQNEVITSTSRSGTLGSGEGKITLGTIGDISVLGF